VLSSSWTGNGSPDPQAVTVVGHVDFNGPAEARITTDGAHMDVNDPSAIGDDGREATASEAHRARREAGSGLYGRADGPGRRLPGVRTGRVGRVRGRQTLVVP
jgi:hypothetical protein